MADLADEKGKIILCIYKNITNNTSVRDLELAGTNLSWDSPLVITSRKIFSPPDTQGHATTWCPKLVCEMMERHLTRMTTSCSVQYNCYEMQLHTITLQLQMTRPEPNISRQWQIMLVKWWFHGYRTGTTDHQEGQQADCRTVRNFFFFKRIQSVVELWAAMFSLSAHAAA